MSIFLVDTLNDAGDDLTVTGDLAAEAADGEGLSLREALSLANAATGPDEIGFLPSLAGGTLRLAGGTLRISDDIAINGDTNGDGAPDITISGDVAGDDATGVDSWGSIVTDAITNTAKADNVRVMIIGAGQVALNGLVITGGVGVADPSLPRTIQSDGGGILVRSGGALALSNVSVSGNSAVHGGGINHRSSESLTVSDSFFGFNRAAGFGGGLSTYSSDARVTRSLFDSNAAGAGGGIKNGGTLALSDSTLTSNSAGEGGGLYNTSWSTATDSIWNTTFSGNRASTLGGGILNDTKLSIGNSTFTGNHAGSGGAVAAAYHHTTEIRQSTITGNSASRVGAGIHFDDDLPYVTGSIVTDLIEGWERLDVFPGHYGSHWRSFRQWSRPLEETFEEVVRNPHTGVLAGRLADNGGHVPTIAILPGGAADGSASTLGLIRDVLDLDGDGDTAELTPVDARGVLRVSGGALDHGAFEIAVPTEGADLLLGSRGPNTLDALGGDDSVMGFAGDDRLSGGDGDDVVLAWRGADKVLGGAGADFLRGDQQDDRLFGQQGDDWVLGNGGADRLLGQAGHDVLDGGGGGYGDTLDGGSGDDRLFGRDGDDTLIAGPGRDKISGGEGADVFVFAAGDGIDDIVDWEGGSDRIELTQHTGLTDFDEVLALAREAPGGRVFIGAVGDSDTIVLVNTSLGALGADDFIFA